VNTRGASTAAPRRGIPAPTAIVDACIPEVAAVTAVNDTAAAAPGAVQLHWPATGRERTWLVSSSGSLDVALAAIATDAIKVATGPRGQLLHRCEAHGCIRIFLREHARRRWCSNTCGDRVRAARHYRRARGRDGS